MTGGWDWVALAYGASAIALGGYTLAMAMRTAGVRRRLDDRE